MQRELIGALIQVSSAILAMTGVTLQRRAMMIELTTEEEFLHPEQTTKKSRFSCSKLWFLGFCMYYSSQGIEMLALSFASQSTIVAVSSFGVFLNAFVAVRVFHESFLFLPPQNEKVLWRKLFKWDFLNLAITVTGSVCVVLFAPRVPQKEEHAFTSDSLLEKWIQVPFVIYFVGSVICVPIMLFRFFRKPTPLNLACILAILSSFSITLSKIVTELIERDDVINIDAFGMIVCWISLLVLQIILLQKGLKNFEQSGTFSVGGMLGGALTIMSGMFYYQTYHDFENKNYVYGFAVGVILLLYGILVFSQRKILSLEEMTKRMQVDLDELTQQPLLSSDSYTPPLIA